MCDTELYSTWSSVCEGHCERRRCTSVYTLQQCSLECIQFWLSLYMYVTACSSYVLYVTVQPVKWNISDSSLMMMMILIVIIVLNTSKVYGF